jgi:hypothetical protein
MAKASIRRSGGRLLGDGMAGLGLFLGYLGLAGWAIYGIPVVVHPLLPSTQRAENRKQVVLTLETIDTANVTYASTYDHGYAPTLAALGPPETSNPNASTSKTVKAENRDAAGLIAEVIASGEKEGYRFTYSAGKKDHREIVTYTVHADPLSPEEMRHFFTDESGVIRQEYGKEATVDSMPILDAGAGG